ncbi:MAG: plasmid recombination protein [Clostridia bacterium]|nr:plasmid recombination protein [Clostridia bacterium]
MASVDFHKCKNASDVAAMMRHNDAIERMKHKHANKDIDITRSNLNTQWLPIGYKQTLERYESRINNLDSTTNTNKRKDRVTCFSLCIPIPAEIGDSEKFSNDIKKLIEAEYGTDNIINAYLHRDEVHDYIDHGVWKTSLEHLHILVVPEIDGKICGKKFSGKTSMISLNNKINEICLRKYGCSFLTGEAPQKKTVEQLKKEGEEELRQLKANLSRTSEQVVVGNAKTVTLPRETYNNLSVKAALYDGRNEKTLAETRAVRNAAEAVEKRYNNAVSLEYNAFEREIREKELVAENERLRRQIDFIKRGLAEIDRFLSKYNEYGFVKVIRKAVNNIINIIELKAVEVIEK